MSDRVAASLSKRQERRTDVNDVPASVQLRFG